MRFFCMDNTCADTERQEGTCGKIACQEGCMPLSEVKDGHCVCVRRHNGCGKLRRRLLDLGLTPHVKVDVVRRAPLGGPLFLKVGDYTITLSASEAVHVEVALND